MDRTVDPCTDFYRYSCGSWIKNNPIPPDQARWNVYSKLATENQRFLWGILQQAAQPSPARSTVETEIGDYFCACMDEGSREKAGAAPLRAELDKIAALEVAARIGRVRWAKPISPRLGTRCCSALAPARTTRILSRVIGFLTAGGLGLPDRDYYVKTDAKSIEIRQRYVEHVQQMLELAGEPAAQAKTDAQTVMEIETALAKASLTRVDQRDPHKLFHPYTLAKLQKLTPAFPWKAYFAASKIAAFRPSTSPSLTSSWKCRRCSRSRSLDDWKTYLRWHMAHLRGATALRRVRRRRISISTTSICAAFNNMQPLWKRCVRRVDQDLGEALGQVFVEKTFGGETKTRTVKMTKEIETAMQSEIEQLPWMGPATKKSALEKLHAVANKIGYPDHWRDYSSIKIVRDDYFGNVAACHRV